MNDFLTRFRILPLLVLVALLTFALRLGETVSDVKDLTASALAEVQPAAGTEAKKDEAPAAAPAAAPVTTPPAAKADKSADVSDPTSDILPANGEPQPSKGNQPKVSLPDSTLPEVWADPSQQQMSDSPEQMQLLDDLAKRRAQLDAREKALDTREALMKASEKQIDAKITEMGELKDQIEKLLGQQSDEEKAKTMSLVKIYEGMKPQAAADIFNQMDMNVLLPVVTKMSPRKSSAIIALMDTAKANELTVRMTEMSKLPEQKAGGFMGANTNSAMGGPMPTAAPAGSAPLPGLDALGQP